MVNANEPTARESPDVLGKLAEMLTTADVIELNRLVDAERERESDVAKEYLDSKAPIKS